MTLIHVVAGWGGGLLNQGHEEEMHLSFSGDWGGGWFSTARYV